MTESKKPVWEILRQTSEEADGSSLEDIGVPPEARQAFAQAMGEYIIGDVRGLWYPPEEKVGHNPNDLAVSIAQRVHHLHALYNGSSPQSPIEHRMVGALLWLDVDWGGLPEADLLGGGPAEHIEVLGPAETLRFYITPQAKVGKYRADFLLWFILGRTHHGVIVECDGHAFHEKNKEQAARDKSRDRALLTAGYPVMRFTGSEIFADPIGCAEQVRGPLADALFRVSKEGGLL